MAKACFKCKKEKPLSAFYKHKGMADGYLNKCKECTKKDVRDNRKIRIDYYRAYDRERGNRQSDDYHKRYVEDNPIKRGAQIMVGNAVRDGRLEKPDYCSDCGLAHSMIHGHHDDYAKPLEVRWLCPACHKQWHAKHGEGLNG